MGGEQNRGRGGALRWGRHASAQHSRCMPEMHAAVPACWVQQPTAAKGAVNEADRRRLRLPFCRHSCGGLKEHKRCNVPPVCGNRVALVDGMVGGPSQTAQAASGAVRATHNPGPSARRKGPDHDFAMSGRPHALSTIFEELAVLLPKDHSGNAPAERRSF